ncbi:MAG: MarR family transcriptional regulator [Sphingobacteriales bacterium]|nr:MAG: MarR family transcriptional regulator [Sphingobacteriales bacterium]
MTTVLTETKLRLVEELGVLHEQGGMQPAAARVLSLLMVSDKVELSFEEIYETLKISKSAASNAINGLLSTGRIEYMTQPGERKRYFRCKLKNIKEGVQKSLSGIEAMNVMLKKVLDQRPASTKEFNTNLKEMIQFLDFLRKELPALIAKWEARNK